MSNIDAQIQKLRELEKKLELDKRKIEFLKHILESARSYDHKSFKDVKDSVVEMLAGFITKAIESIDSGTPIRAQESASSPTNNVFAQENTSSVQAPPRPQKKQSEAPPADKLNFALDNRHLAGKTVTVANDQNMVIKGKVVGLDAPFILVAVDGKGTLKVPVESVSVM